MTILCFVIIILAFAAYAVRLADISSFLNSCKKININELGSMENSEKLSDNTGIKNKFIAETLSDILYANSRNIKINRNEILSSIRAYCSGPGRTLWILLNAVFACILLLAATGYISTDRLIMFLMIMAAGYIIHFVFDYIFISHKGVDAEALFDSIITKYYKDIYNYEEIINDSLNDITDRLEDINNHAKVFGELSGKIDGSLISLKNEGKNAEESVRSILQLMSADGSNTQLSEQIDRMQKKIAQTVKLYKKIASDGENSRRALQQYTEFFKEYSDFSESFNKISSKLEKTLELLESGGVSADNQSKEIEALLRKIISKQISEIKAVVDRYVDDVYGRITFVMNSNLERSRQTVTAAENLSRMSGEIMSSLSNFTEQTETVLRENILFNQKVNSLMDANSQLVGLFLTRCQHIDANLLAKLSSLTGRKAADTTGYQLNVLTNKMEEINISLKMLGMKQEK